MPFEDRVSELECELELVQKQLIEQEKEANDAINLWQDSFTSSEDKCIELEEKLKKSIASLAEMRDELDTLRSKTAVLEDENAEFKVRSAGQQTSSSDSSKLLNGPEGGHRQGNAAEFAELQNAVEASREMLSRQKESDRMWEGKILVELWMSVRLFTLSNKNFRLDNPIFRSIRAMSGIGGKRRISEGKIEQARRGCDRTCG